MKAAGFLPAAFFIFDTGMAQSRYFHQPFTGRTYAILFI